MTRTRAFSVGLPAALAATALWGFTFLGPTAVEPVNVYYLVVGRYAVFGLMSLAVLACRLPALRRLGRRGFLQAAHLGVVGYIGFYLLLSMAASIGGGVLASLMTGLIPAMVALVSNVLEKALDWRRLILPILLMSGGLVLVNGDLTAVGDGGDGREVLIGTALGFAACLAWSYFVIVNGILLKRAGEPVDNGVWTASIGVGAFGGSLLLVPVAQLADGTSPFSGAGTFWSFLAWCAAMAVLGSWCATWFWNVAAERLPTTMMGPIIGMEAVFGVIFHLMWDGRPPTFLELVGGGLVICGVFFCAALFHRARAAALRTAPVPATAPAPVGHAAAGTVREGERPGTA